MSNPPIIKGAAPAAGSVPASVATGHIIEVAAETRQRIEMVLPDRLAPNKRNARTHSAKQVEQIARSIERFGFVNPVLVDDADQIIAGHGRVEAAKRLGLDRVPVLRTTHLSAAECKAYALADNRLAELAVWDVLAIELLELRELNFDIAAIGFELDDVDIAGDAPAKTGSQTAAKTERGARTSGCPVSRAGDVWLLGPHHVHCSDAGDNASYAAIDSAIQRWQGVTGEEATLAGSGKSFAATAKERVSTAVARAGRRQRVAEREMV
ncbi:MAG: ParB/Srx family N-terminal domain-containing protein [Xanthobacteraceae bacterium]